MATAALRFWSTSVGKKMVMAVTGFIIFGFVFVHMLGNLQLYVGPAQLNAYGALLHHLHGLIWVVRATLLTALVLHMIAAYQVWMQSRHARPVRYKVQVLAETTYAARTMIIGGPVIALFLIYHLAHFTTGQANPSFVSGDVYHNVVAGFQVWWASAAYIVAMVFVGLHLYHGVWSMLQTLGASHPKYNPWRQWGAAAFAVLVAGVNISFPVSVLAGWVK